MDFNKSFLTLFNFSLYSDHEILLDVPVLSSTTGLTIYGDKLYWTDKIGNAIRWVKKYPPYDMGIVLKNRENLESITMYHKNRVQPGECVCTCVCVCVCVRVREREREREIKHYFLIRYTPLLD